MKTVMVAMKQLNNWQSALFMVGALLMVCGAALSIFRWHYFPYLYAVGAIAFVCMQLLQRYDGPNVTLHRLRRIVVLSDVLLLLAAVLMFATQENPFGIDRLYYLNYVHNNWVVVLLLAAILQLYTSYRIGHELEKEAKKL